MSGIKSNFTRTIAFSYRNLIFLKRNIFTFFEILFWPMVGLFSIGLMGNFLGLDEKIRSFILTGVILSGVLQVTQLDVSYGALYEIWSKSIKQIFIAPVKHFHYILGSWFIGIIRGGIVFVFMTLLAKWFFGFVTPPMGVAIVALGGIFFMALIIGMGVTLSVLVFGQRIDIVAWSITILLMLVSGIYYPVSYLPASIRVVAKFLPLTYILEYFRLPYGEVISGSSSQTPLILLIKALILIALYISIFYLLITLAYRHSRKTGGILRLSE